MTASAIADLVQRQRPGWSLEQAFYTSSEVYAVDRLWMETEWFLLAYSSELPGPNTYVVRELLGESLIITRDEHQVVRAFYNVCRHRGSRICQADGKGRRLMCPYHAWSYRLDGSLLAAAAMPPEMDTTTLGLNPVGAREVNGLIMISLKGDPAALDDWSQSVDAVMQFHGLPQARIAARRAYSVGANWKLVIENGLECYHCFPSHPEYCSVLEHTLALARVDPEAAAAWAARRDQWRAEEADPAGPGANRYLPIGEGFLTQSQDGKPVAPLMGRQSRFNGGMTGIGRPPFMFATITNDHVIAFQILPTGAQSTEVIATWLVDGGAEDEAIDVERMIWLWDVTTAQDRQIIEDNAAGVRSDSYRPGPYSLLEDGTVRFVSFYLEEISRRLQGDTRPAPDAARDFSASGLSEGQPAAVDGAR